MMPSSPSDRVRGFATFDMFTGFSPRSVLPLGIGLVVGVGLLVPSTPAGAVQPPAHLKHRDALELAPGVTTPRRVEAHEWRRASAQPSTAQAYARLQAKLGGRALTRFDADTGILDTVVPAGLSVPNSVASPAAAEAYARAFLAEHLPLLAPGARATDFQLVANVMTGDVRSLGFVQSHDGRPVVGGQISFRFKADRLIAVRSQAVPGLDALAPAGGAAVSRTPEAQVRASARRWIADDFAGADLAPTRADAALDGPKILPLVRPGGGIEAREVYAVEVQLDDPHGRWEVFIDARTGKPVARRSLVHYAELRLGAFQRNPLGARVNMPASFMEVNIGGQTSVADVTGTFPLTSPQLVSFEFRGERAELFNAAGELLTPETMLTPAGVWIAEEAEPPELDAHFNAYAHTEIVKQRVLAIDPSFEVPLSQTAVTVNIDDVCNAFADGDTINFFLAGAGCENTALIADVVYHEYGHVAHVLGLVPGVGIFSGSLSEGAADYLAATIVDDAGMGRGFYQGSDEPLRDLDPPGSEWTWPGDQGGVHFEGQIIGGTLWDLRELLIAKYGYSGGVRRTDEIWLQALRRAVDIPSMYLEALVTNDDDGNLQNGTPDICEIDEAFGRHGLFQGPTEVEVSVQDGPGGELEVRVDYQPLGYNCPSTTSPTATLEWRQRAELGVPAGPTQTQPMASAGASSFVATIAGATDNAVVQYRTRLDWGQDVVTNYPRNDVDPWYEAFVGDTQEIWCSDFENGAEGWTLDGSWQIGSPGGASGDPASAFEGQSIAGTNIGPEGLYPPFSSDSLTTPVIDASGYERVRLQYRRWLTVEDGYFDQAFITANGQTGWQNLASVDDYTAHRHHRDQEWRFHDVDLTAFLDADGEIEVGFNVQTDGGLEFGGWNVDAVCIVGTGAGPGPDPGEETGGEEDTGSEGNICGDGILGPYEQCDDGNLENGDGCSSGCLFEDEEEPETDTGETGGDEVWLPGGRGCGCTADAEIGAEGRGFAGTGALALLALLGLRRRRRE